MIGIILHDLNNKIDDEKEIVLSSFLKYSTEKSISIKVGKKTTKANYYVDKPYDIISLLKKITKSEG